MFGWLSWFLPRGPVTRRARLSGDIRRPAGLTSRAAPALAVQAHAQPAARLSAGARHE